MEVTSRRFWHASVHALRIVFGAVYLFFGLNFYLHFVDLGAARNPPFISLMIESGFFHLVKGSQLLGGGLLLINRYVVFGLLLLSATTINIVAFYLTFHRAEYGVAGVFGLVNLILLWAYRREYLPLLRARTYPS